MHRETPGSRDINHMTYTDMMFIGGNASFILILFANTQVVLIFMPFRRALELLLHL